MTDGKSEGGGCN